MWIANNKLLVAAFTVSAAPVPAPVDADLAEGAVVRRIILWYMWAILISSTGPRG